MRQLKLLQFHKLARKPHENAEEWSGQTQNVCHRMLLQRNW